MKKSVSLVLLFGILVVSNQGQLNALLWDVGQVQVFGTEDDDYNNDDYDPDDDLEIPPKILSTSQTFSVNIGSVVKLPCKVDRPGDAVIQWRKNQKPLFFGDTKQIEDIRYSIDHKDFTLTIENIAASDADSFSCQNVGVSENDEIIHHIIVKSTPKIKRIVPEGPVNLEQGTPQSFMCEATGYPEPTISWKRKLIDHHEERIEGPVIKYDKLTWRQSGNYTCVAENSKGEKDEKTVIVVVKAAPEIEVPSPEVNSAENYESEIVCNIYSVTGAADVEWVKDHEKFINNHHHHYTVLREGEKHILRISATRKNDFGTYTCKAKNSYGSYDADIVLTGLPLRPRHTTTNMSQNRNPVITWTVISKAKLEVAEITFKRQQDDEWTVVYPEIPMGNGSVYTISHQFTNLQPDTYVAKMRAKNVYGYSPLSEECDFPGVTELGGLSEGEMQSKYLESSIRENSASQLELRISLVFILSLLSAHYLH